MLKLKDKVILIADDEEKNTFALRSYLETHEMKTLVAKDGVATLQLLKSGLKADIILLDIMMPVMDGYETLAALKQHSSFKEIPVIAVTAKAMKGDMEKCLDAGAWDYVSKPLDLKILIDKISKWLL